MNGSQVKERCYHMTNARAYRRVRRVRRDSMILGDIMGQEVDLRCITSYI